MSVYVYAGTHTGPDSFDACTGARNNHTLDTVNDILVAERDAHMAYWYNRGMNDVEVGDQVGVSSSTVLGWRRKRGHAPNK